MGLEVLLSLSYALRTVFFLAVCFGKPCYEGFLLRLIVSCYVLLGGYPWHAFSLPEEKYRSCESRGEGMCVGGMVRVEGGKQQLQCVENKK